MGQGKSEYWWLSFVHREVAGDTFAGVALVRGTDFRDALQEAHTRNINPGGEAAGATIPDDMLQDIPPEMLNRLLGKHEADILVECLDGKYPSRTPEEAGVQIACQDCNVPPAENAN